MSSELMENCRQKLMASLSINHVNHLFQICDQHQIWQNPLIIEAKLGGLTFIDYQYIFSQYYFYSKNFTKLLAVAMLKCDSDYYRSELSRNLWEESGEVHIEQRHAEIYRKFLTQSLKLNLENINFKPYAKSFFNDYLNLCLESTPLECAAILAFATEGIIAKLYSYFREGLISVGVGEHQLKFFNIHIANDDEHAKTLQAWALSFLEDDEHWFSKCEKATIAALNLRDTFFTNLYHGLRFERTEHLFSNINEPSFYNKLTPQICKNLVCSLDSLDNPLYKNDDELKKISFTVDRFPFKAEVLDPRVVHIPVGHTNESHRHAHETVFYIIAGVGEVIIDAQVVPIKVGDTVFIPRWYTHQTKNTGTMELIYFAVTDYGLTKLLFRNSEEIYRANKAAVNA